MKTSKISLFLTLTVTLLLGVSASGSAFGHGGGYGGGRWHGGTRVGIYFGAPIGFNYGYYPYSPYRAPYYGSPYYGSPYYSPVPVYYPPVQSAPIYTEQSNGPQINPQEVPRNSSQKVQESWWYYCVDSKTYYPYVNQCPGGWLKVAPQPASGSNGQPALNNVPMP